MSTIIKASGARDFLGLIPSLIGYTPRNSIVVIPFAGNRTLGAMRFDLPDEDQLQVAAITVTGIVCKLEHADGAAVIVYTERDASRTYPALQILETRLQECGLRIVDLLYVASDGYGSLAAGTEPRPVSELLPHPDAPAFAAGDQTAGAVLPAVDEEFSAAVCTAIGEGDPDLTPEWLLNLAERTGTGISDATDLAQLHWYLERPLTRDVLLMTWVAGQEIGMESLIAQMEWAEDGTDLPDHLGRILIGDADQPDPARLQQALENVRYLLAAVPQPGAYSAAGWLAWGLGHSTEADKYAEAGLAQDPEHGMCGIIRSFVTAGHLPDWAFTRRTEQ